MKITIIVPDKSVYEDGLSYSNLDFSSCNIPTNVRVLQFNIEKNIGWLEFYPDDAGNMPPNEAIEELPTWVNACMTLWDEAHQKSQEIPILIPNGSVVATPTPSENPLTEAPKNDTPKN